VQAADVVVVPSYRMAGLDVPHTAVARFWSASNGLGTDLIDQLRSEAAGDLIEPERDELIEQIGVELELSKSHLRSFVTSTGTATGGETTAMCGSARATRRPVERPSAAWAATSGIDTPR
jgi:hypothetical protein